MGPDGRALVLGPGPFSVPLCPGLVSFLASSPGASTPSSPHSKPGSSASYWEAFIPILQLCREAPSLREARSVNAWRDPHCCPGKKRGCLGDRWMGRTDRQMGGADTQHCPSLEQSSGSAAGLNPLRTVSAYPSSPVFSPGICTDALCQPSVLCSWPLNVFGPQHSVLLCSVRKEEGRSKVQAICKQVPVCSWYPSECSLSPVSCC